MEEMERACSGQWAGWAVQRWGSEVVDVVGCRELAGSRLVALRLSEKFTAPTARPRWPVRGHL